MNIQLHPNAKTPVLELHDAIASPQDALCFISSGYENNASKVLLRSQQLPPDFFDLQTGFAGEFIQKLVNYRFFVAGVFEDLTPYNVRFQEFIAEARNGPQFRSFATEGDALSWLDGR